MKEKLARALCFAPTLRTDGNKFVLEHDCDCKGPEDCYEIGAEGMRMELFSQVDALLATLMEPDNARRDAIRDFFDDHQDRNPNANFPDSLWAAHLAILKEAGE